MRLFNFLEIHTLKLFFLTGFLVFNTSLIHSQEAMEDANISISFSDENDSKTIIAKALDQSGLPIEDLELYFFVKRTFSLLPIGDSFNVTDENGLLEVEFPKDLPGDTDGNVIIITKIIESDLYNDFSMETIKNWGIPVILEDPKVEKRSLWAAAANAPITLIICISSMILAVWYIIFYILFKLYKISKITSIQH